MRGGNTPSFLPQLVSSGCFDFGMLWRRGLRFERAPEKTWLERRKESAPEMLPRCRIRRKPGPRDRGKQRLAEGLRSAQGCLLVGRAGGTRRDVCGTDASSTFQVSLVSREKKAGFGICMDSNPGSAFCWLVTLSRLFKFTKPQSPHSVDTCLPFPRSLYNQFLLFFFFFLVRDE